MSYSFQVKGRNKTEALDNVGEKVVEIIGQQPSHERDRFAILRNVTNVIALLVDDDSKDVHVSCNGYLSWIDSEKNVIAASVCCQASLVTREA